MLTHSVVLRDWNIFAEGVEDVIYANSVVFDASENISVSLVNVFGDGKVVIAELIITINSGEPMRVVDILEFTDDYKISSIRAYKG